MPAGPGFNRGEKGGSHSNWGPGRGQGGAARAGALALDLRPLCVADDVPPTCTHAPALALQQSRLDSCALCSHRARAPCFGLPLPGLDACVCVDNGLLPACPLFSACSPPPPFPVPRPPAPRLSLLPSVDAFPRQQVSGFYVGPDPPRNLVRFAYCKDDAKLHAAVERLTKYLGPGGKGAPATAASEANGEGAQ